MQQRRILGELLMIFSVEFCEPYLFSPLFLGLKLLGLKLSGNLSEIIFQILALGLIVGLNWGWLHQSVYWQPRLKKWGYFWWTFAGALCLSAVMTSHQKQLGYLFILAVVVALDEEYFFRGVLLGKCLTLFNAQHPRRQRWQALVLASALFGLTHLTNLSEQGVGQTLLQMIQASGLGLVLGAIYFLTSSLWCPVLLHFIWDFTAFAVTGTVSKATAVTVTDIRMTGLIVSIYIIIAGLIMWRIPATNRLLTGKAVVPAR